MAKDTWRKTQEEEEEEGLTEPLKTALLSEKFVRFVSKMSFLPKCRRKRRNDAELRNERVLRESWSPKQQKEATKQIVCGKRQRRTSTRPRWDRTSSVTSVSLDFNRADLKKAAALVRTSDTGRGSKRLLKPSGFGTFSEQRRKTAHTFFFQKSHVPALAGPDWGSPDG